MDKFKNWKNNKGQGNKKVLSVLILTMFSITSLSTLLYIGNNVTAVPYPPNTPVGFQSTPYYIHDDFINIWYQDNGSDVHPYPYANQPMYLGMNYFKTRETTITGAFSFSNLNDTAIVGDTSTVIYSSTAGWDVAGATTFADQAKLNVRLKGLVWDDFDVGHVSASTLAGVYSALHHEDVNLSQAPLKLVLVVYDSNYWRHRDTVSWADYNPYFDILDFWLAPSNYGLVWNDWAGFEDSFEDCRKMINNESKEYWFGIYLYFYNTQRSYPDTYIKYQLAESLRFIKENKASKLHILGSFWILNMPYGSLFVRNFIEQQYDNVYITTCNNTDISTTKNGVLVNDGLVNWMSEAKTYGGYKFKSLYFQKVIFKDSVGWYYPIVQEIQSGHELHDVEVNGSQYNIFYLEPDKDYRIYNLQMSNVVYTEDFTISSPTTWSKKNITLACNLDIKSTLTLVNTTIRVANFAYELSAYNSTKPEYKIMVDTTGTSTGRLVMYQSMIEATHRQFNWEMDTNNGIWFGGRLSLHNSTIANWAGWIKFVNYTYIHDTNFWMPSTDGDKFGIMFHGVYNNQVNFTRNIITLPDTPGAIIYLNPGSGFNSIWNFHDNSVIGGQYIDYDSTGCGSPDYVMYFKTIAPLCNTPTVGYTKFMAEVTSGGTLVIYETLNISNYGDDLDFALYNNTGDLVRPPFSISNGSVLTYIEEVNWNPTSGFVYVNTFPLELRVLGHSSDNIDWNILDFSGYYDKGTINTTTFDSNHIADVNEGISSLVIEGDIQYQELIHYSSTEVGMITILILVGVIAVISVIFRYNEKEFTLDSVIKLIISVSIAIIMFGLATAAFFLR